MVESMVALVLLDGLMQQRAQCQLFDADEAFPGGKAPLAANPLGKKLHGHGAGLV